MIGFAVDVSPLGRAGFLSDKGNKVCNVGMETLRLIRDVLYDGHAICPKGHFIDGYLTPLSKSCSAELIRWQQSTPIKGW